MDAERLGRIQDVFLAALDRSPQTRAAFLDRACQGDLDLRQAVERYLQADGAAEEGFLEAAAGVVHDGLGLEDDAREGDLIGPYRVLRPLGRGGMGSVYLAVREAPYRRYVALKVIRWGAHASGAHARFSFERQVLASLDHPAIARLYDGGLAGDGRPYFAMEYVDGAPITAYCDHHRLGIDARVELFLTVCEAVQYAHQRLVVHRDLKPSNILVARSEDGQPAPKLLDFGIAKVLAGSEGDPALTGTGLRLMTPEYAAPEQVLSGPITTATDVYALGLLLYRLLAGHPPYAVPHRPGDADRAILEATPKRLSTAVRQAAEDDARAWAADRSMTAEQLQRRLRGDLDVICLKALEKEPERRYQSAEQLRDDLRRHVAGLPIEARAPTARYRARKFVKRHRAGVAAALLATIGLVTGLGAALWQAQRAAVAAARAEAEAATAEQVKEYLVMVFGASDPWEQPRGPELTARELLAQGVERVGALEGQPAVQAELLNALGEVHSSLGLFEEARALLERALASRQALRGAEHEEVAESMASLAALLVDMGAYEEAEELYRDALAMRRRLLSPQHIDVAAALNDLALVLIYKDAPAEAEPLLHESLAIQRRHYEEEQEAPSYAVTLANLAGALRDRGAYEEAEELYREALAIQRRLLGPEHPNVASSLATLALVRRDLGDYGEAEALMRETLVMRRKLLGEAHDLTAGSRFQLGRLLLTTGQAAAAEPLFRQAVDASEAVNGPQHWKTALARVGLGRALTALGRYEEAAFLLEEAHATYQREDVDGPPNGLAGAVEALVELYTAWGKPEQVAALEAAAALPSTP